MYGQNTYSQPYGGNSEAPEAVSVTFATEQIKVADYDAIVAGGGLITFATEQIKVADYDAIVAGGGLITFATEQIKVADYDATVAGGGLITFATEQIKVTDYDATVAGGGLVTFATEQIKVADYDAIVITEITSVPVLVPTRSAGQVVLENRDANPDEASVRIFRSTAYRQKFESIALADMSTNYMDTDITEELSYRYYGRYEVSILKGRNSRIITLPGKQDRI